MDTAVLLQLISEGVKILIGISILLILVLINQRRITRICQRKTRPKKPVIYVCARIKNPMFKRCLEQELGTTYHLEDTEDEVNIDYDVVLVYGQSAGRDSYTIGSNLDKSPGDRSRRILLLFDNVPLVKDINKCYTNRSKKDVAAYIVRLEFSATTNTLYTSRANCTAFVILSDALKKLTHFEEV